MVIAAKEGTAISFVVLLFAVAGGFAAYHLKGRRAIWRGVLIGAVVGAVLPLAFGVVAVVLHLLFLLAAAVIVALGVLAVIRHLL